MKKSFIYVFLSLVLIIILVLVVMDFSSNRPGRMSGNPYKLDVDEIMAVDPELISYRETRNYDIRADKLGGIALSGENICIGADDYLQMIDPEGKQIMKIKLPYSPECLTVSGQGNILVGFRNGLALYSPEGEEIWKTDTLGERAVFTAVRMTSSVIYVADAGQRAVHRYTPDGSYIDSFEGKTQIEGNYGFIVPSPNFDLAIAPDGELWVANPGKHSIENYTGEGKLRAYWENMNPTIDGFSGCCNPAHIDIMTDGSFVTSEKGVVRIKIHKPSGEFATVVAAPDKFLIDGEAPDVAVHEDGTVYALDYDSKTIRVFETK
jgi:outer membrane protein assembly factor BamB